MIVNFFKKRIEVEEIYQDLLDEIYEDACRYLKIETSMNNEYIEFNMLDLIRNIKDKEFLRRLLQICYTNHTGEYQRFSKSKDIFKYAKKYARNKYEGNTLSKS